MTDPLVLLQILWTGAATSSIFVPADGGLLVDAESHRPVELRPGRLHGHRLLRDVLRAERPADAHGRRRWRPGPSAPLAAGVLTEMWGLDVLRARRSGSLMFFIFTLILAQFIIYVLTLVFGTEPQTLFKSIMSPVRIVGGIAISNWDLLAVATTVAMLGGLCTLFLRVDEGRPVPRRRLRQRQAGRALRHQRQARLPRHGSHRRPVHLCRDVPDGLARRRHAQLAVRAGPGGDHRHAARRHGTRVHGRPGGRDPGAHSELQRAGDLFALAEPAALRLPVRHHHACSRAASTFRGCDSKASKPGAADARRPAGRMSRREA